MALKGILLAITCSFTSAVMHLLVTIFGKGRREKEPLIYELMRHTRSSLVIWIVGFLFYAALFFLPLHKINILISRLDAMRDVLGFTYGVALYLFLSFVYLTFYYMADRSVSATILEIIDNADQRKLKTEDIKQIYDVEKKYQSELKGMLEGGFIIKESGYYKNSLKGHAYAFLVKTVKAILKLGPGG